MPLTGVTPRWQKYATFCLLVAILGVVIYVATTSANTSASVNATNQSSARRDCATAYNADFTEVVRKRDALNVDLIEQLATALLNAQVGVKADAAAVQKFSDTKVALDKAAAAVEALPKLDDAVNHGYVLNGVAHPHVPVERNLMTATQADTIRWHAHARVDKFDLEQIEACRAALGLDREPVGAELLAFTAPRESVESVGNLLVRQGLRRIMDRLAGTSSNQALDATHCRIGVGDTATAAAATDTDLGASAGSTHRQFKLVDSVTVGTGASSGVLTIVATFATTLANFAWAEWGIDGGTGDGTTVTTEGNTTPGLCNHKIASLGTKTSSAQWVFTITITVS